MDGTCADLGRAQLLAMLWIAQSLQKSIPLPPAAGAPRPGIFARIAAWIAAWWRNLIPTVPLAFKLRAKFCAECDSVLEDPEGTICPKCAAMILEKMNASSEEECRPADNLDREQVRAQAVKLRPIDPQKPHVFMHAPWGDNANDPRCWVTGCGKPELDAIHGYTGD
jgi:hypothetical protein